MIKGQPLTERRGKGQHQVHDVQPWGPGCVTDIHAPGISKVKMLKKCEQDSNSLDVIENSKF